MDTRPMKPDAVTGVYVARWNPITKERYEDFRRSLKPGQFRKVPVMATEDGHYKYNVQDVRIKEVYPHICKVEYYSRKKRKMITTCVQNKEILVFDEQEQREAILEAIKNNV